MSAILHMCPGGNGATYMDLHDSNRSTLTVLEALHTFLPHSKDNNHTYTPTMMAT